MAVAADLPPMFGLQVDEEIRLAMPLDRHAAPMFQLLEAERDRLERWLPNLASIRSLRDQRAFYRSRREDIAAGTYYSFIIEYRGEPAGIVGLNTGGPGGHNAEIGFMMSGRLEGRGVVTRSVAAVIDDAIRHLDIHRFEIRCEPANDRSRGVATRLGFRHEATLRDAFRAGGEFRDDEVYALLAPDWIAGRPGRPMPTS